MAARMYVVTEKSTGGKCLVLAKTPAGASNYVAGDAFEAHRASPEEVAQLMQSGAIPEDSETGQPVDFSPLDVEA